jgi:hypothetical protein
MNYVPQHSPRSGRYNRIYRIPPQTVSFAKAINKLSMSCPNIDDILCGQSSQWMALPRGSYPVQQVVGSVLFGKSPPQIASTVITSISVAMCNLMKDAWWASMKGLAYKAVNFLGCHFSVHPHVHLLVPVYSALCENFASVRTWSVSRAADPPQARELIISSPRQSSPLFILVHSNGYKEPSRSAQDRTGHWR